MIIKNKILGAGVIASGESLFNLCEALGLILTNIHKKSTDFPVT
jgi:hypothetical protein